ncbi:MAG: murein biosynthesis integral membrane protein MurJ [Alkaliphilus sp.]
MTTAKKTAKSVTIIMIFTLGSKFLGFLREVMIANKFGAGVETDAFFVALTVSALVLGVIATGINTTLIPILAEIAAKKGTKAKNEYLNNFVNVIVMILSISAVMGALFAPSLVRILAKGFSGAQFELAVELTRIALIMTAFIGAYTTLIAFLHNNEKFTIPAAIGFPMNAIYLFFLFFLTSRFGIRGLMIAAVLAVVSQLIFVLPSAFKSGFRYKFRINLGDVYLKKNAKLAIPVLLGVMVHQVNVIIDRTLASTLVAGSISALNFANRLNGLILGVFVVSITTVVFPMLSKSASENDFDTVRNVMKYGINLILLITIPVIVGILILSTPIVQLLFERGAFDATATQMTSVALVFYSLGLVGIGTSTLLQRVYFSMQDTKTPMYVGVVAVVINIVLNLILINYLAHGGLALATSIALSVSAILLILGLKKKMGYIGGKSIFDCFIKASISSVVMGVVVFFMYDFMITRFVGTTILNAFSLASSVAVGALVYFVICYLLNIKEVRLITNKGIEVVRNRF